MFHRVLDISSSYLQKLCKILVWFYKVTKILICALKNKLLDIDKATNESSMLNTTYKHFRNQIKNSCQ